MLIFDNIINNIQFLGETALMLSAWRGDVAVMELLLMHGASLHVQNEWGKCYL